MGDRKLSPFFLEFALYHKQKNNIMKNLKLNSLEVGSHYVLLNSENNVVAVIRVVEDLQTTINKIVQAIIEDKFLEDEDTVIITSAIPQSCDLLIKVKITQQGYNYIDNFSLIKTDVY